MAHKVSAGRAKQQHLEHSLKKAEAQTVHESLLQAPIEGDKQERNDFSIDIELQMEAEDDFV
jgi:hypothetical protein